MNNILSFPDINTFQKQTSKEEVDTSTNSLKGSGRLNDYLNENLHRYAHYRYNRDLVEKYLDVQGGLAGLWLKHLYVTNYDSEALNFYSNEPFVFSRTLFVPQSWIDTQIDTDKNVFQELWVWAEQKIKHNLRGGQNMTASADELLKAIEKDAPHLVSMINFEDPYDAWDIAQKEAKTFFPHLYFNKEDNFPKLVQADVKWGVHEFNLSPRAQSLYESLDVQNMSVGDVEKISQDLDSDFFGTDLVINEVMVQLLRDYFKTTNGVTQDELSNILMESQRPTFDSSYPILKTLEKFNCFIDKFFILTSIGGGNMTDLALNQYQALFFKANQREMLFSEKLIFVEHFSGKIEIDNHIFGENWGKNIHFSELILKKYTNKTRSSLIQSFSNYFNRNPIPFFINAFSPNYLKEPPLLNKTLLNKSNQAKKKEDLTPLVIQNPFEFVLDKISFYSFKISPQEIEENYVYHQITSWMQGVQKSTPTSAENEKFWNWTKNNSFSNHFDYLGSGYGVSGLDSLDYYFKNLIPLIDMMGVDTIGRNPTLRFLLCNTDWIFSEEGEKKTKEKEKMEQALQILVNYGAPLDMPDQFGRTIRKVICELGLKEPQFQGILEKKESIQKVKLRLV